MGYLSNRVVLRSPNSATSYSIVDYFPLLPGRIDCSEYLLDLLAVMTVKCRLYPRIAHNLRVEAAPHKPEEMLLDETSSKHGINHQRTR